MTTMSFTNILTTTILLGACNHRERTLSVPTRAKFTAAPTGSYWLQSESAVFKMFVLY